MSGSADTNQTFDDGASDIETAAKISNEAANAKEEANLAKNENRGVCVIRVVMLLLLAVVAVIVSYSAFLITSGGEQFMFEAAFRDQATKVKEAFQVSAESRMTALEGFSQAITSHAVSSYSVFPKVTLPDFERQASYTLKLSDTIALITVPIIQADDRESWEQYTNTSQGWIQESWDAQSEIMGTSAADDGEIDQLYGSLRAGTVVDQETADQLIAQKLIVPTIYKLNPNDGAAEKEDGPGPYAPIWQHAPVLPVPLLVNYNAWSHPTRTQDLTAIAQYQRPLLSSAADFRDDDPVTAARKSVMNLFLDRWQNGTYEYEDGPVSDVYFPIFDHNGPDKQMKSVLTAYVYWQSFFQDLLPEDRAAGIIVILENSCNQSYSYEINGKTASYLGKGDAHDPKYNHMMVETGMGAVLGSNNLPDDLALAASNSQCFYNVKIYPSEATEKQSTTNIPKVFACTLAGILCFTSAVFLLYDWCVARRHRVVETKAVKSGAVVRSLFPEKVVERLYDSADRQRNNQAKNSITPSDFLASRMIHQGKGSLGYDDIETSEPIADLYPECTVFFADIAGFTRWSSSRQPTDVFRFLETLYRAFDKVANNRNVFKVETIGDCYVAVTGLPNAQPNHAVIMAKFAADCMVNMSLVLHKMVPVLGPDTASLSMRCGLHSGAVTAGILRGEKARFQLFGDTVNTAARMESTGMPGKIQVSEATALLLMKRGKTNWLRLREDAVAPKGKGIMTTYWVEPKGLDSTESDETSRRDEKSPASSHHSTSIASTPSVLGVTGHKEDGE